MNTKKAIWIMGGIRDLEPWSDRESNITLSKDVSKIIELLQQGEKYKQIIKDIKNMFKTRKDRDGGEWGNNIWALKCIDELEQKEFPEEK